VSDEKEERIRLAIVALLGRLEMDGVLDRRQFDYVIANDLCTDVSSALRRTCDALDLEPARDAQGWLEFRRRYP